MITCTKCERSLHKEKIVFSHQYELCFNHPAYMIKRPAIYEIVLCKDCVPSILRQLIEGLDQSSHSNFIERNSKCVQELELI